MSCMDVVSDMVGSIDEVNTQLTLNMIAPHVRYEDVCVKPNITFDFYSKALKTKWETIINKFIKICFINIGIFSNNIIFNFIFIFNSSII